MGRTHPLAAATAVGPPARPPARLTAHACPLHSHARLPTPKPGRLPPPQRVRGVGWGVARKQAGGSCRGTGAPRLCTGAGQHSPGGGGPPACGSRGSRAGASHHYRRNFFAASAGWGRGGGGGRCGKGRPPHHLSTTVKERSSIPRWQQTEKQRLGVTTRQTPFWQRHGWPTPRWGTRRAEDSRDGGGRELLGPPEGSGDVEGPRRLKRAG